MKTTEMKFAKYSEVVAILHWNQKIQMTGFIFDLSSCPEDLALVYECGQSAEHGDLKPRIETCNN